MGCTAGSLAVWLSGCLTAYLPVQPLVHTHTVLETWHDFLRSVVRTHIQSSRLFLLYTAPYVQYAHELMPSEPARLQLNARIPACVPRVIVVQSNGFHEPALLLLPPRLLRRFSRRATN